MLTSCADYRLTRRTFVGAAAGTFLGMHVRNLLAFAGTTGKATAEHVILFWNGGGMSHIDTWDPKPGRPTQGEFDADQDRRGRHPDLRDLPRVGQADEARGPDPLHRRHQRRPRPGHLPAPDQLRRRARTCSTPASARSWCPRSKALGDLPAYITISGLAPKAGYLGQKCEAYFVGRPGEKDPYLAFPAGIAQVRGNKRLEILERINKRQGENLPQEETAPLRPPSRDAVRLMRSPALEAFEVNREKPEVPRALRRQRLRPGRLAGPPAGREGRAFRADQPRRLRHAHATTSPPCATTAR